ncbi:hypothetical protein SBC1_80400 (plasmid) [Caballeronia sp. SBC1]|uniref:hypothetical protein n=1 Tax=unclassified Caballeronia TaxID=2646786 RepID=UPI001408EBA3|nr:hypothetical protein [Caballeronia sp. SBC1]QIN67993.1 hypothetical protein SBC1_80400 [Caballeronia sp. SBC1]
MNSIVCHPFYQIAQGGAMVLPEVQQLTAAQLAFTGYLDKWAVTDKSGNPRCADTYREAP